MRLHRLSFGAERHSNTFHSERMFPGVSGRSFTEAKAPKLQTGTCCAEGQGREREGAGQAARLCWQSRESSRGSSPGRARCLQGIIPKPQGFSAGAQAGEGRKKGPACGSLAPGCIPAQGMGLGAAGLAASREKDKHGLAWREAESLRVLWTEPGLEDLAEENTYCVSSLCGVLLNQESHVNHAVSKQ